MSRYKPIVLVILDGWGISNERNGNAISNAKTPCVNNFYENYPHTTLETSGETVGLPHGQMGNSEVGHLSIGSGRIIYQELTRINKAIENEELFKNPTLINAFKNVKDNPQKAVHIMGLLSDGGVHSHLNHLFALLEMAKELNIEKLYLHCFLDGRDVPPKSALNYIEQLEEKMQSLGIGEIASISGRYYAMDRDKRWERVEKAYRSMTLGEGQKVFSAKEAVEQAYKDEITDEFVLPTVIYKGEAPLAIVEEGDSLIFFNFRGDRAREITRAFVDKDFDSFKRPTGWLDLDYVCFTEYDEAIKAPVAFPSEKINNTFGQVLSNHNLKQLRVAETEKYAHVTFFFNGGQEVPYPGEDRILIASCKVPTYDMEPEMSAGEITEKVVENIEKDIYDVIIVNYANPDMVGHTGCYMSCITAIETVDRSVKMIVDAVLEKEGVAIITADHGNAETMVEHKNGNESPHTAHTTNPVPFIIIGLPDDTKLRSGILSDIVPTILEIMEIEKPKEMTGESLIENQKE